MMRNILAAGLALGFGSQALAADINAGKQTAENVCAACHGANGISVKPAWPNLAGQKSKYLVNQLKAFKSGKRKNVLMNAIAPQLSDSEIENVAAYFASLTGSTGDAASDELSTMLDTHVTFRKDYKSTFTIYGTVNRPDNKQVRYLYANKVALEAAAQGKPLPHGSEIVMEVYKAKLDDAKMPIKGKDGYFVKDKLAFYGVMASGDGWGKEIPDVLRNGDWNYAIVKTDGSIKKRSQADCFACHKPLDADSYLFSFDKLKAFVAKK